MLTDNKEISNPEYWDKIYEGKNDNAKVDASNTVRPANPFDRFQWVADIVEGPNVIDIGSGHAHICKRVKSMNPDWKIIASDQAHAAKAVANFDPYIIISGYAIPFGPKRFNTIIISQALEYFEHQDKFMEEAKRVAHCIVLTVPIGEMEKWSQLHVYQEDSFKEWMKQYGTIEFSAREGDLLLLKVRFHV